MGALLDRAMAVVLDHAAPENRLPLVVGSLQFQPRVVRIDGAAGKEMSNLLCTYDNIDSHRIATSKRRLHTIQRSRNWRCFSGRLARNFGFCFLAYRECRGQIRL